MLREAREHDRRGNFHAADRITAELESTRRNLRLTQAQNQQPTPTSPSVIPTPQPMQPAPAPQPNFMGSALTNGMNQAGAFFNSYVLQDPLQNIRMLYNRIAGLRQDIATNATETNTELIKALCNELDDMLIAVSSCLRPPSSAKTSKFRLLVASVKDISGLEGMFDDLQNLSVQVLQNTNPPLLQTITWRINNAKSYLTQYEQGVASGYQVNTQALNYVADPHAAMSGYESRLTPPAQAIVPQPQGTGDNWFTQNGTTPEIFLARCRAWAQSKGGRTAIIPHLQENNVPQDVISYVDQNLGSDGDAPTGMTFGQ